MDRYVVIDPNGQVVGRFPNTPNGCEEAKEYAKRLSENSNEHWVSVQLVDGFDKWETALY